MSEVPVQGAVDLALKKADSMRLLNYRTNNVVVSIGVFFVC